jgi:archaellum component FlaC
MKQRVTHFEHKLAKGSGGGNNGDMEPRIARIEASIGFMQREITEIKSDIRDIRSDIKGIRSGFPTETSSMLQEIKHELQEMRREFKSGLASIRTDCRILFATIIAATVSLGGMIAKSSGWF